MTETAENPVWRSMLYVPANVEALDAVIGGWIGARTLAENVAFFEEEGVTVGAVADISDLMEHPFIVDRGILLEFPDPEMGRMAMHSIPARLSETPGAIRRPAPEVGQHNGEILGEIGLDQAALEALAEAGVI